MAPGIFLQVASDTPTHFLARRSTPVYNAFAESSSEAAALPNGEEALTPIIAGSVTGSCVILAWAVSLVVILIKRRRRWKHFKNAGRLDLLHEVPREQTFIVPPDPAVLERAFENMKKTANSKGKQPVKTSEFVQDVDRSGARHTNSTEHEVTHEQPHHRDFATASTNSRDEVVAGTSRDI